MKTYRLRSWKIDDDMANKYKSKRTEHAGAKNGCSSYWGRRADAKRESAKTRREVDRREAVVTPEKIAELRQRMRYHGEVDGVAVVVVTAAELGELLDLAESV